MDVKKEVQARVEFIKQKLAESGARGIVFGNSGGKDSALVGILCKMACDNTLAVILPCHSKLNYTTDKEDGLALSKKFDIETRVVDLTSTRMALVEELQKVTTLNDMALVNIAPRLRMTTLYGIGASEGRLVAGTGNRSERFVGYFTKWGDGGCDFNPISDLTVGQVYEMLEYLGCPREIIDKAPSASLYDGQTDEKDMGFSYAKLDEYILNRKTVKPYDEQTQKMERMHQNTKHKRQMPSEYCKTDDDEF